MPVIYYTFKSHSVQDALATSTLKATKSGKHSRSHIPPFHCKLASQRYGQTVHLLSSVPIPGSSSPFPQRNRLFAQCSDDPSDFEVPGPENILMFHSEYICVVVVVYPNP